MTIPDRLPAAPANGTAWWAGLALAAAATCLLRWHTVSEPLDCDEAAYAYIGHRLLAGDRLYADVFENKPPTTYLIFAAAITVGGYTEGAIRLAGLPFVLVTLVALACTARRAWGSGAGWLAAGLYALTSHDSFTFGETSNLEVFMNAFLTVAFGCALRARADASSLRWPIGAGLTVGAASTIKQVVLPHAVLVMLALGFWSWRGRQRWWRAPLAFALACAAPWLGCLAFCAAQGVVADFFQAVFVYAPALTLGAGSTQGWQALSRFVSGNPDVPWWGWGTWPLGLMAAVGAMYWWGTGRRGPLGFAAAWTAASYLAAHLPGLFWQHYYLLGLPGLVMLAAAGFGQWAGDISAAIQTRPRWAAALACGWCATGGVLAATLAAIQYSDYWRLEPEQIAMRHKGGEQWVELRRVSLWLRPLGDRGEQALVWGWQSPLHVYSRMDSVTPYFFTDPLMKKYAASYHPLVEPRKQRILQDAREHRPAIVFAGDRPFPELARFLNRDYVPLVVQEERGLYVRPDIAEHVRKALQEPRRP